MKKRTKITLTILPVAAVFLALVFFLLVWNGVILLNRPSEAVYPVRGVDVSSYQGDIDWEVLSGQGIQFAFIKATEGSGFVDEHFAYNYAGAQKNGLRTGAYHFFSYDSPGEAQAENFIRTVEKTEGMLPPVIDIEFYGDKEANPPAREAVQEQLDAMIKKLEEHYAVKPILYATEKSYQLYIDGAYDEYDIWIRNVITAPALSDGRKWTFWQYTNRARLDGYQGEERYIDLNVFCGDLKEFERYGR